MLADTRFILCVSTLISRVRTESGQDVVIREVSEGEGDGDEDGGGENGKCDAWKDIMVMVYSGQLGVGDCKETDGGCGSGT